MTSAIAMAPRFDMGRVAKRTFGSIGRNWVVFLALAVLLTGVPQALFQYFMLGASLQGASQPNLNRIWAALPTGLIMLAASSVLQAALVHGTVADLNGRKASFGDCLATGVRYFLPVIAIAILETIAVGFGFLLFIVPAIIMALTWLVAVPAEVTERTGVLGAFSRSADLTRNHRWSLLGLCLVYALLSIVVSTIIGGILGAVFLGAFWAAGPERTVLMQVALSLIVQPLQTMVATAGIASVYYELRSIKEGVGPEQLAAVFD